MWASHDARARGQAAFQTTRWSLVAAATDEPSQSNPALAELCQLYWYPLYAFVRRRGYNADDSCDLTQSFFTRLLEKNDLAAADASRGRFRSFLLACLSNFLANEFDRNQALKRGGGRKYVSFSRDEAEARFHLEAVDEMTPERCFDRQWALLLLERVLASIRREYDSAGSGQVFDALKIVLTSVSDVPAYADLGKRLGLSEGAVKVAVHRLRTRYRERLRQTIADSVASDEDVDDELRHLFDVFARPAAR